MLKIIMIRMQRKKQQREKVAEKSQVGATRKN